MKRAPYIFVASGTDDPLYLVQSKFLSAIDVGDEVFYFNSNVAFIQTAQDVASLSNKFRLIFGDRHFFVADISDSTRGGAMNPRFWEFLRAQDSTTPGSRNSLESAA